MKNAREKMRLLAQEWGSATQDEQSQKEEKPELQETRKPALRTAQGGKADRPTTVRRRTKPPATETPDESEEASVFLEQMTIKLEPEVRNRILGEVFRRKSQRLPNRSIQAVVSEAVNAYLGSK